MERSEYALIEQVQGHHWWWLGRNRIIQAVIERYIDHSRPLLMADAGCGFGANIPMLRQYGAVVALEQDDDALRKMSERYRDAIKAIKWKSPEPLDERFDLVLFADVLEHIPDDAEAVAWTFEHLRDGGHVLLTVPAHGFLWSEMDEFVHHYRRYSRKQLVELFTNGFDIRLISYYDMVLFPVKAAFVGFTRLARVLWPARPKRSYNDVPPSVINHLFKHLLSLEARVIPTTPLPFGISIILLAQKRPGDAYR